MGWTVNSILTKRKNFVFHPFISVKKSGSFSSPPEKGHESPPPSSWVPDSPWWLSALGTWGGAFLTTELDVHTCQQNGQGKAASARCHQRPTRRQQLQELKAVVDSADFPESTGASQINKVFGAPRPCPCLRHWLRLARVFWRWRGDWAWKTSWLGIEILTPVSELQRRGVKRRERDWRLYFQGFFS